jgi:hypothetical protein
MNSLHKSATRAVLLTERNAKKYSWQLQLTAARARFVDFKTLEAAPKL